jgi:molecular chaperone GrpE
MADDARDAPPREAGTGRAEAPEPEPLEAEATQGETVTLDAILAEKDAQIDQLRSDVLYQRAELENFKKRTEKRYREALEYATEGLLKDLLPVLDNLERALEHGKQGGPEGLGALLEGLGHVIAQFQEVLGRHGAEAVASHGARFDPAVHDAVAQVPGPEDGMVAATYEKGYLLKGRLLRPAKVTVTKVAPPEGDG